MLAIKGGGGSGATATPKPFTSGVVTGDGNRVNQVDEEENNQMALQTCDAGMSPVVDRF